MERVVVNWNGNEYIFTSGCWNGIRYTGGHTGVSTMRDDRCAGEEPR